MIAIPGDIFNDINMLICGPHRYYHYLDKDYNGGPSNDEKLDQASWKEDLSLTLLRINSNNDTILPLLSTSILWGVVYGVTPDGGSISFSLPLPGTKLLAPPLKGVLLIAPSSNRTVKAVIGKSQFVIEPGSVLRVEKPANVTMIVANTSIVGILYNLSNSEGWATELIPSNFSYTPIIGLSQTTINILHNNCSVMAYVVDERGNYTSYSASSIFTAITFPKIKGVVYYHLTGCGKALSPEYPSLANHWPRPGLLPLTSEKGLFGGQRIIAIPTGSQDSIILVDINSTKGYDLIIEGVPGDVPIITSNFKKAIVISRGEAPILAETTGKDIIAYSLLFPSATLTPPSGIMSEISGESLNLISSRTNETLNVTISVIPRTGAGGVVKAVISAFTPDLKPIIGSFRQLIPENSTSGALTTKITFPLRNIPHGYYLSYLILYQEGIGYGTTFRGPPPVQLIKKIGTGSSEPAPVNGEIIQASNVVVSFSLRGSYEGPSLKDVDFKSLAKFIASARSIEPVQTQTIPVEKIIVNGTLGESQKKISITMISIIIISIIGLIIGLIRLSKY